MKGVKNCKQSYCEKTCQSERSWIFRLFWLNTYKDVSTNVVELLLNLLAVLLGHGLFLFGALGLLLDGGNDTPGWSPGTDNVLISHAQQVSLLVWEFGSSFGDGLHASGHVVVAFGLFSQFGLLDLLLLVRHAWWSWWETLRVRSVLHSKRC